MADVTMAEDRMAAHWATLSASERREHMAAARTQSPADVMATAEEARAEHLAFAIELAWAASPAGQAETRERYAARQRRAAEYQQAEIECSRCGVLGARTDMFEARAGSEYVAFCRPCAFSTD